MKRYLKVILGVLLVVMIATVQPALADQSVSAGNSTAVDLNFEIIIPTFVYFRVGTALTGSVDLISFSPTANDVATGTTIGGAGGDLGGGAVTVTLITNRNTATIDETNDGLGNGLDDGGTNYISYAQINTADTGSIPAPVLSDAGGGTSVVTPGGPVINVSDVWTYTYVNPATPPVPGTYTGTVTYTVTVP